ncbi:MAG: hypothetical protein A2W85_14260 [Bacteroidetes bacterium GWF2_41_31]|nr:MAG: hypothetical protein A2W85_14260 [Bacteroidetes bacterium GWF2_41_31]OFZ03558.1 MAG: hypothetical protein A2338_09170 [Bacteroidetes bacterium RIFOXYB12_FULL_41_6]
MNKDEFIGFMQQPTKLDSQTLSGLTALVNEFPYCSTVRILLSVNQYKEKDVRYETELRTTAVYSGDRSILKKHIDRAGQSNVRIVLPDEEKAEEVKKAETSSPLEDSVVPEKAEKIASVDPEGPKAFTLQREEPEMPAENIPYIDMEIQELKEIINRHIDELEQETHLKSPSHVAVEPEKKVDVVKEKSKEELLDEFIKNQPSITRPKAAFFNPLEVAKESIVDQENIISETLATIYYDQGHLQKAIKIYQKLSLKYPEKSTYFAALIQKAEKELNT